MAWIEQRKRRKGTVYKVRWRDLSGAVQSKTFGAKREAEAFSRRVEVAKEDGTDTLPALGKVTVAEF